MASDVLDQIRAKWLRQYGKELAGKLEVELMPLIARCEGNGCNCASKYLHC